MIVVYGATHSQNDGVEGNGGSLKDGVETFVLFLRGAQLVMRSSVFTAVPSLDEVDVTLKNAEIFGSVLSGEGGCAKAGGAAEKLPVSLNCPLPLHSKNPPRYISSLVCCFCFLQRWE